MAWWMTWCLQVRTRKGGGYVRAVCFSDTVDSSQGSIGWTQYTVSTQSSQDELPESLQLSHAWSTAFPDEHKLIDMGAAVNMQLAKQFQAAGEFCKISGLLCCYGLYQVSVTLPSQ